MDVGVRRATLADLESLIRFASEEAREAEGIEKAPDTLRAGIAAALENGEMALYWVLVDEREEAVGNISALREWSNWNAGFYWWVQSLYIVPEHRGKGYLRLWASGVRSASDPFFDARESSCRDEQGRGCRPDEQGEPCAEQPAAAVRPPASGTRATACQHCDDGARADGRRESALRHRSGPGTNKRDAAHDQAERADDDADDTQSPSA